MSHSTSKPSADASHLPKPIVEVRDKSSLSLEKLLHSFFLHCDDALFELAETADSNSLQNLYFEAMRELRIHATNITDCIVDQFKIAFAGSANASGNKSETKLADIDADQISLELVGNDALEVSVASQTIVNRSRLRFAESLMKFSARFQHLMGIGGLDDDGSPLDPGTLLKIFSNQCNELDTELPVKLKLFEHFEHQVIEHLGPVIDAANQTLIDAGVLPGLKLRTRNLASHRQPSPKQSPPAANQASFQDTDDELVRLVSALRQNPAAHRNLIDLAQYSNGSALNSLELSGLLSNAHDLNTGTQNRAEHNGGINVLPEILQSLLQARQDQGQSTALHSADENTINLVSMFFDFVLDDEALPLDMQALLARLQIPVLKVALRDRYLFTTREHPLRHLINELARASYGRDIEKQEHEAFYELANRIVQQLTENAEAVDADFQALLISMQDLLQGEDQKSQAIEQRVSQSARNNALTRHAREKVGIVLGEKFKNKRVPTVVSDFLQVHWQKLMLHNYLNFGDQSSEWLESEQLADDLLWTAQAHRDERSRNRLERLLPELYKTIEKYLANYQQADQSWQQALADMRKLHELILAADIEAFEQSPISAAEEDQSNTPKEGAWANSPAQSLPEFRYLKAIGELREGDWIRLKLSDHCSGKYCKVSAFLDTEDSVLLVNRFGARFAILARRDLAQSLQDGRLKIIEDTPLFDLAVASISSKLSDAATEHDGK
ncbi:MAG: DUF1631 family protein [Pseudomonadales bacterium]